MLLYSRKRARGARKLAVTYPHGYHHVPKQARALPMYASTRALRVVQSDRAKYRSAELRNLNETGKSAKRINYISA